MNKYKTIGILGGMGAEATVDLYMGIWKYFQENFNAKYDYEFPPVIIYSVPIPDVVESLQNEEETLRMLQDTALTLEKAGCAFIVIACNTVQFLLDKIRSSVTIPIIGIAEVTAKYLTGKGYKRIGILATKATIEKGVYNEALSINNIELMSPSKDDQQVVTKVIMNQLAGKATQEDTEALKGVINNLSSQGAQGIILACTDLPLVISQKDSEVPIIDCTRLYADEAAQISAEKI